MATTLKLNTKNGSASLKDILFPASVSTLGTNIFKTINIKTKEINNLNKKIFSIKNKSTVTQLIQEIKDLYAKLDLSVGKDFLKAGSSTFVKLFEKSATPATSSGNFGPLYNKITKKIPGQDGKNIGSESKFENIKEINAEIRALKGLSGKEAPTGTTTDAYTVRKLYQLYLIVYYLHKLVTIDERELERQSLYKIYKASQTQVDEYVKGKPSSNLIQNMSKIIDAFISEIQSNINTVSSSPTFIGKIAKYKTIFNKKITDDNISAYLGSGDATLINVGKLTLFFHTNTTLTNIFDYVFNVLMLKKPNTNEKANGNAKPKNVIKNVRNIDSRKLLLQLIKLLSKIMPEFKSKELHTKLKNIKNSTNPLLVENLNKSLINFLK